MAASTGGDVVLMLGCGVLVVVAVVLAWSWRGYALSLPTWAAPVDGGSARPARAFTWLAAVALLTGLLVGVLVVGPAGRLAMRLLAATSPDAQGRTTEADQVVGQISLSGTLAFFIFVGVPFGLAVGVAYALAAFILPRGMAGGAVFGIASLVVFGSTLDPLRSDNPDFDIVGPGWLSVTVFAVMAVLTGMLTAPIAGRLGAALAYLRKWWAAGWTSRWGGVRGTGDGSGRAGGGTGRLAGHSVDPVRGVVRITPSRWPRSRRRTYP